MKKLLLAAVFIVVVSFSSVAADPVVLWSGSGTNTNSSGSFAWTNLQNATGSVVLNLVTGLTINPIAPASFGAPGQLLTLNFFGSGNDVIGTLTLDGVNYAALANLRFTASALAPANVIPGETHLFTQFSFSGAVCAGGDACPILFSLVGTGIVDATVEFNPNNGIYVVRHVTYTFQTPEPASLLLFGSGLIGIAGAVLRQRFLRR